jgi:glucose-6-phosphate isomerase
MTNPPKIVVFDLDETLGTFVELGMFCDALENYTKNKIERSHFFELMDLFEEFLRPDIMNIMSFLVKKRAAKKCKKLMIYTNNQGDKSWAINIKNYFDKELNYKSVEGNNPTSLLQLNDLSPKSLGYLLATYEHKVFVESRIYDINPFDQWGVQLGKQLTTRSNEEKDFMSKYFHKEFLS